MGYNKRNSRSMFSFKFLSSYFNTWRMPYDILLNKAVFQGWIWSCITNPVAFLHISMADK